MTASDKFMTNQWLAKALLCKYPFLLTFPNSRFLTTAVVFLFEACCDASDLAAQHLRIDTINIILTGGYLQPLLVPVLDGISDDFVVSLLVGIWVD
jgi:hypothetical protein